MTEVKITITITIAGRVRPARRVKLDFLNTWSYHYRIK